MILPLVCREVGGFHNSVLWEDSILGHCMFCWIFHPLHVHVVCGCGGVEFVSIQHKLLPLVCVEDTEDILLLKRTLP